MSPLFPHPTESPDIATHRQESHANVRPLRLLDLIYTRQHPLSFPTVTYQLQIISDSGRHYNNNNPPGRLCHCINSPTNRSPFIPRETEPIAPAGMASLNTSGDTQFTVFIRLPFPRGDFVDPPPVNSDLGYRITEDGRLTPPGRMERRQRTRLSGISCRVRQRVMI